jgi:hypothetical protein
LSQAALFLPDTRFQPVALLKQTSMRRVAGFTKSEMQLIFDLWHGIFCLGMKTSVQAIKSRGTVIAEKARAKGNKYTDQKRSALLERGMAIIYGGPDHAKAAVNRG